MLGLILKQSWPLFLGMFFLMLGNGLQGTLISWRAAFEGFSPNVAGLIGTGYYIGFLLGSRVTQTLVLRVGHIRVFAALASLASTAILVQVLYISPVSWFLMRLLTGFCFAGTYVIVEGWLNEASDNRTRGSTLSFYLFVSYGGLAAGQGLMNSADPTSMTLFILTSILLSFALIPVLIARISAPEMGQQDSISLLSLIKQAPAGTASIFFSAIAHGAMFAMGAVYAVGAGLSISQTTAFMGIFIALGALAQFPLGWLSDRIDRRIVVVGASLVAAVMSLVLIKLTPGQSLFFLAYGVVGAASLPIYSLGLAHTNDRLPPEQMTSASSALVLLMGVGAILGPLSVGYLLEALGPNGFFIHLAVAHIVIVGIVAVMMLNRDAVADADQTPHQAVPSDPTPVAIEAIAQEAEDYLEEEALMRDEWD